VQWSVFDFLPGQNLEIQSPGAEDESPNSNLRRNARYLAHGGQSYLRVAQFRCLQLLGFETETLNFRSETGNHSA
jgi:hypothetical protein